MVKGVSPVIATVLIVAIAIAAAVVAYSWFMAMQATVQAEASRSAAVVGKDKIMIEGVQCFKGGDDGKCNDLKIYLRNIGDEDINGLFTVYIRNPDEGILSRKEVNQFIAAGHVATMEVTDIDNLNCEDPKWARITVEIKTPGGSSYSVDEKVGPIQCGE